MIATAGLARTPAFEPISGALTFARFAAPPNVLGYCGGSDADGLLGHLRAGLDGPELVNLCRAFEGAWPYLTLIATEAGIADPLDYRVVEAYWLGNGLLDGVSPGAFRDDLAGRFRPRTRPAEWRWLAAKPADGSRPHHSFHVLEVMPRIGMLRAGQVSAILPAMEQCLIRPATVVRDGQDGLVVAVRPLLVRDGRLVFGPRARADRRRRRRGPPTRRRRRRPLELVLRSPDGRAATPARGRHGRRPGPREHDDLTCPGGRARQAVRPAIAGPLAPVQRSAPAQRWARSNQPYEVNAMDAVIVYESLWGNTAAVARAVAEGFGPGARALTTDEATPAVVADADVLVVGAPVIAFGLASDKTREGIGHPDKHADNPPDVAHPSVKSWLASLPAGRGFAAAFETRLWWSPRGATGTIEHGLRARRLPDRREGREVRRRRLVRPAARGRARPRSGMGQVVGRARGRVRRGRLNGSLGVGLTPR